MMERLDPKHDRAHKRASFLKAIASAVIAGAVTFAVMFLLVQLNSGTSGLIGAAVAVMVVGIVSAITTPTPRRRR